MFLHSLSVPAAALLAAAFPTALLRAQEPERVSVDSSGVEANGASFRASIDRAGRWIAFDSAADNLVAGDTNGVLDAFVHDRITGITARVSVDSSGTEADGSSLAAKIAALAGQVVFISHATNLVPGDTNNRADIFVRDRASATTELVSLDFAGGPSDGSSSHPSISAKGRFVAFDSDATDIVPGDANGQTDCFLRDMKNGVTICVSVDPTGAVASNGFSTDPKISANASVVIFYSEASNLVAGDTNGCTDVFLRDLASGITRRISVGPGGIEGDGDSVNAEISEDGLFVVYQSRATNLVAGDTNGTSDVFVYDVAADTTRLVSQSTGGVPGDGFSSFAAPSSDGRFVAFLSNATNLSPSDTNGMGDVFVRDELLQITHRVSLGVGLLEVDLPSYTPLISGDGRVVVWYSDSDQFVPGDTNQCTDIFVREQIDAEWENYGYGLAGTLGIPSLKLTDVPRITSTVPMEIENSNPLRTTGVIFGGFSDAQLQTGWDADLLVDPYLVVPIDLGRGITTVNLPIPELETLEGLDFYFQVLELDPGASDGISFTPGLHLICGW